MSNITCPKPYTTSNEPGAIPCGMTYAEAIGHNQFQALRILAIVFCFTLLIITIIQCIRLIYYRGIRPFVQIHGIYALVLLSVASQAVRSIDPQGWSVLLHPTANQILGDISTCAILCTAFLVAMSWLKIMRRIAGKPPSKIYQVTEWIMPYGLLMITLILSVLQTQVHNPGTYVFTMIKYTVFVLFIASFTITLWTQGIPLFIALNQTNGVAGSSIPSTKANVPKMHMTASPSSPHKTLQSQPSSSALAIDAHLIRQPSLPVHVMPVSPHQVNIEMIEMEPTTYGASDERSSFATNYTHSSKPSIFPDHIQPVRTSINAQNHSNPASTASSPSMGHVTRTISTPSPSTPATASPVPDPLLMIGVTTTQAPASSPHSSTGKKKAKMTRILKLIVAATCVSLAAIGFQISRIVGDYQSKFDDRDRPKAVPIGTFGSIFPNILLGIFEYLACIVILTFFRQMRGDGSHAYSDTPQRQSKQTTHTHTYTQHTRVTVVN